MSLQMTRVLGNPNTWVEDLPINHGKSLHIFPLNFHVDGCEGANEGMFSAGKGPFSASRVLFTFTYSVHNCP